MAEYIERKKAIKALTGWETEPTDEEIEYTLNNIPAADVVKVVRCKKCKYSYINDTKILICEKSLKRVDDKHFCGYGERKAKNG